MESVQCKHPLLSSFYNEGYTLCSEVENKLWITLEKINKRKSILRICNIENPITESLCTYTTTRKSSMVSHVTAKKHQQKPSKSQSTIKEFVSTKGIYKLYVHNKHTIEYNTNKNHKTHNQKTLNTSSLLYVIYFNMPEIQHSLEEIIEDASLTEIIVDVQIESQLLPKETLKYYIKVYLNYIYIINVSRKCIIIS